jgi:MFS family permease
VISERAGRAAYLAGYGVSATGTGLALPLTALYVSAELGFGARGVALYFAVLAGVGMAITPLGGVIGVRWGPRAGVLVGAALQAVGFLVLSTADALPTVLVAAAVAGAGNGVFFANLTTFLLSAFGEDGLGSLFGWQYAVANVAVAVAAVVVMITFVDPSLTAFRVALVFNAVSYVVHGAVLALIPAGPPPQEPDHDEPAARWFVPFVDRRFFALPLVQLGVVAFGIVQLDSVIPLIMDGDHALGPSAVAAVLVVNGLSVVAFQKLGNAFADRRGSAASIIGALLAWILAAVLLVVGLATPLPPLMVFLGYALVFAAGEVLVPPALQPWVVAAAPRAVLPVYAAAVSLAFGVGQVIGPAVGASLLDAFDTTVYLVTIMVGLAALLPLVLRQRRLTPTPVPPGPDHDITADA